MLNIFTVILEKLYAFLPEPILDFWGPTQNCVGGEGLKETSLRPREAPGVSGALSAYRKDRLWFLQIKSIQSFFFFKKMFW